MNDLLPTVLSQTTDEVWRLQTHWTWAPWVTFVFVACAVAAVVACYKYETTPAGFAYRAVLSLLRLTTIALLLIMLSEAVFSGSHTTTWTYDGSLRDGAGGYVNDDSYAASDDRFPADSVLVLRVEVGDAGYRDPAGNPVPETTLTGSGAASLFHGGQVVQGTWSKQDLGSPLTLRTGSGDAARPLPVPPGHTWIELVPRDGGRVSVQR